MKILLRGAVWFGFYLVMILLPLLVGSIFRPAGASDSFLVNLSAGLGYVGFAIMALELALISRFKPAASAFGLDVLQQFHKEIGMTAFLMVLAHPLLLVVSGYPWRILLPVSGVPWSVVLGTVAFLLVALLIGLSVWRKKLKIPYEVWQITHGLLTIALIAAAAIHIVGVGRYAQMTPMKILWAAVFAVVDRPLLVLQAVQTAPPARQAVGGRGEPGRAGRCAYAAPAADRPQRLARRVRSGPVRLDQPRQLAVQLRAASHFHVVQRRHGGRDR